jgi:hypothetical protein
MYFELHFGILDQNFVKIAKFDVVSNHVITKSKVALVAL